MSPGDGREPRGELGRSASWNPGRDGEPRGPVVLPWGSRSRWGRRLSCSRDPRCHVSSFLGGGRHVVAQAPVGPENMLVGMDATVEGAGPRLHPARLHVVRTWHTHAWLPRSLHRTLRGAVPRVSCAAMEGCGAFVPQAAPRTAVPSSCAVSGCSR